MTQPTSVHPFTPGECQAMTIPPGRPLERERLGGSALRPACTSHPSRQAARACQKPRHRWVVSIVGKTFRNDTALKRSDVERSSGGVPDRRSLRDAEG